MLEHKLAPPRSDVLELSFLQGLSFRYFVITHFSDICNHSYNLENHPHARCKKTIPHEVMNQPIAYAYATSFRTIPECDHQGIAFAIRFIAVAHPD
jgi:hypothetical protein